MKYITLENTQICYNPHSVSLSCLLRLHTDNPPEQIRWDLIKRHYLKQNQTPPQKKKKKKKKKTKQNKKKSHTKSTTEAIQRKQSNARLIGCVWLTYNKSSFYRCCQFGIICFLHIYSTHFCWCNISSLIVVE